MNSRFRGLGIALTIAGALWPSVLGAENWPQWRGPSSWGVSSETDLPATWSATDNIAWKASLAGFGASSPVVWEDTVFVTSQVGSFTVADGSDPRLARDDQSLASEEHAIGGSRMPATGGEGDVFLVVEAFRRSDGGRLWEHRMPAASERPDLHEKHNLATPTPTTDGERIYAWFGDGQVVALDTDGNPVWTRSLADDFGTFVNTWGHGTSPTLYKDLLILLVDHDPVSYLLALDKRTGERRWMADRGKGHVSHSTPVAVPGSETDELIISSTERIDAYDPADGRLLWHLGEQRQTPIPTPVFYNGTIIMSRGYRNSDVLAIRPGGRGDVSDTHIAWRIPNGASYTSSVLQYQGLVYMTNEVGVVTCSDAATGERLWRHRLRGVFFSSPVGADGKVFMVSETGDTFVLRAGREPELLATNTIDERFMASPAISGGRIFLRSDGSLFAIGGFAD